MKAFRLDMMTPELAWAERSVVFLDVPAETGRYTVLAGHQPMVLALQPGAVRLRTPDGVEEQWETGSGLLHVTRQRVTLLAHGLRKLSVSPGESPV